ncbi:CvfB family protein [Microaceticoccus formicicus]|uniref:CvfB family protein n=1 Tax=Microaceticoccus formicicus TaxID=3118105 RepID=UPI003CD04EFC|nr:S1-like domain-containing RNA-binding protein [Peptoniphilaceae bacterium AMB_02]
MLGKSYKARIKTKNNRGAILVTSENKKLLLPASELGNDDIIDTELNVFVYNFDRGEYIATKKTPLIELGQLKVLEVKEISKIGIFLDWGLEKDLFLPFQEVTFKPHKGMHYLFGLYVDKSNRLCATMRIKESLVPNDCYKENDWITGTVYGVNRDYGAFVAVDNKYDGLVHNKDLLGVVTEGESLRARVISITDDGKLNLSLRDRAHMVIDDDADKIYSKLVKNDGFLRFNDKSSPNEIRKTFGISKSSFKKAIGKLYKNKKIEFFNDGIKLKR